MKVTLTLIYWPASSRPLVLTGELPAHHHAYRQLLLTSSYAVALSPAQKVLLAEVCTLIKLILVMPATNAASERSFSARRRVKSYLRTTMTQGRLNHLMLLHVHNDRTKSLEEAEVARRFVAGSEHRLSLFGRF